MTRFDMLCKALRKTLVPITSDTNTTPNFNMYLEKRMSLNNKRKCENMSIF